MPICLQEHDYIGLSEVPAMENSEKSNVSCGEDEKKSGKGLNLKATELRLGLPGSESPEREKKNVHGVEDKNVYSSSSSSSSQYGLLKGLVSGAKRGFSDTIHGHGGGSGKWGLSVGVGSEVGLDKNGVLFSPRGGVNGGVKGSPESNTTQQSANLVKESVVPQSPKALQEKKSQVSAVNGHGVAPAAKAQVVGWPPIRSFRKNSMATNPPKTDDDADTKSGVGCLYVKVSMDGAPYLRKVDLKTYHSYNDLSSALEKMFSCFTIGQCGTQGGSNQDGLREEGLKDLLHASEYVLTFEDKDGDWMLVGDVPWEMFTDTCKRLRIMKSSDAIGLAPRAMEKCKAHN